MAAKIIDGKHLASEIHKQIISEINKIRSSGKIIPSLAVVLVGNDPASAIYVRNKHLACEKTGIISKQITLPNMITQEELLKVVNNLNNDPEIHGILVQFPLPNHISSTAIIEAINPKKDVDGFHPYNIGRLVQKEPLLRPCTPYGVIHMLKSTCVELEGKDAIVVGASTIVGRPMALELLLERATVTVCHSKTKNLSDKVSQADIVIAAVGNPEFIKGSWIKEGAIVIDVGINRTDNGHLVGDVEFDEASSRAGWITHVPGGVGPMTIAMLLKNTLIASKL